jgi:hypothetical protein
MKSLECTACGSKELLREAGNLVCAYCQSRFTPGPEREGGKSTAIDMQSDIDALLAKCVSDPGRRVRYARLILDIDPTNTEAIKYLD